MTAWPDRLEQQGRRIRVLQDYLSAHSLTAQAIFRAFDLSESDIVFITGSVVDEVGDSESDLDIYILTSAEGFERRSAEFDLERKTQQARLGFGIIYRDVLGRRLDAECHPKKKFVELLQEFSGLDPLDRDCLWQNFRSLGRFEREEAVELLHRLRISVPIYNEACHQHLLQGYDESKFFAWNTHFHLIEAEDFVKGVTRSLNQGDDENAYLKLQRLYDSLADAKLFANGQSLDRWKWRLPKLRRLDDAEFLALYLDVQFGSGGRASLRHRVSSLLERARDVHQEIYTQLRRSK